MSWHGTHASALNLLTDGSVNNCGWQPGQFEQSAPTVFLFGGSKAFGVSGGQSRVLLRGGTARHGGGPFFFTGGGTIFLHRGEARFPRPPPFPLFPRLGCSERNGSRPSSQNHSEYP